MPEELFEVETKYGLVKGIKRTTCLGKEFYSFRGIPYAKPPIGDLRFKDPQPPMPWTGTLDATKERNICLSWSFEDYFSHKPDKSLAPNSSEDCLFINIHTKDIKELGNNRQLPVMVWIHGGAFMVGSGNEDLYGPDYLLEKDVVLVTFNYRLGVLGFMSFDDPSINVPGNAGLKDQTMALNWIRENISYFCGDVENITIFGESAGGCSVHFHLLSDLSKNLFDKAIIQSGSALAYWANTPKSQSNCELLAKLLGWNGEGGTKEVYEVLKNADANQLVLKQTKLISQGIGPFVPGIESFKSEQCFFSIPPEELCLNAWSIDAKIPVVIGGVSDEGLILYRTTKDMATYQSMDWFEAQLPKTENCLRNTDKSKQLAKQIKSFYYDGDSDVEITHKNVVKSLKCLGDTIFWNPIQATVLDRIKLGRDRRFDTYLYRFNVSSTVFTRLKLMFTGEYVPGSCHTDELMYLFRTKLDGVPLAVKDSLEEKTIHRMVDMWTAFAATGNPNGGELKNIIEWLPVSKDMETMKCLNISNELSFIDLPEAKNFQFWNSIIKEQNQS